MEQGEGLLDWHVLVPGKIVPALVGSKGVRVQEWEKSSGCRISVPRKNEGPTYDWGERAMILKGSSDEKKKALECLAEATNKKDEEKETTSSTMVVAVQIPDGCVPLVIGKGGSNVKYVQTTTNSWIDLTNNRCEVKGPMEALTEAVDLIYRSVESKEHPGYPAVSRREDSYANYNGYGQNGYGQNGYGQGGYGQSNGECYGSTGWDAAANGNWGKGKGKGGGGGQDVSWELMIPGNIVSVLIGAKGQVIYNMQRESGAQIDVGGKEDDSFDGNKKVRMSGSEQAKAHGLRCILNQLSTCREFMEMSGPSINFLVPRYTIPLIVGSGGKTIKQIERETGAQLSISKKPCGPEDYYTQCSAQGSLAAVVGSCSRIFALSSEAR